MEQVSRRCILPIDGRVRWFEVIWRSMVIFEFACNWYAIHKCNLSQPRHYTGKTIHVLHQIRIWWKAMTHGRSSAKKFRNWLVWILYQSFSAQNVTEEDRSVSRSEEKITTRLTSRRWVCVGQEATRSFSSFFSRRVLPKLKTNRADPKAIHAKNPYAQLLEHLRRTDQVKLGQSSDTSVCFSAPLFDRGSSGLLWRLIMICLLACKRSYHSFNLWTLWAITNSTEPLSMKQRWLLSSRPISIFHRRSISLPMSND